MKALIIILLVASSPVVAGEDTPVNYCHSQEAADTWGKMLSDAPEDPIIIKLYGLRIGLCGMIEDGQIGLKQGIEIWEQERNRSVIQRAKEEIEARQEITL